MHGISSRSFYSEVPISNWIFPRGPWLSWTPADSITLGRVKLWAPKKSKWKQTPTSKSAQQIEYNTVETGDKEENEWLSPGEITVTSLGHLSVSGYLAELLDLIPLGKGYCGRMPKSPKCTSQVGGKGHAVNWDAIFGQNSQLLEIHSSHRAALCFLTCKGMF